MILIFFFIVFILRSKASFLNNEVNFVITRWHWSIFGSTFYLWVILFKQHYIFLYSFIFVWEVRFTYFPKWFGITINTKFIKVLQFGLFIQIFHQVSLSLKLRKVIRIFWLISLVFETWSGHYLVVKVLEMGFI